MGSVSHKLAHLSFGALTHLQGIIDVVKQGVKGRAHLPHFRGRTQVIKAYAALNLYLTAIHRLRSYLPSGSCHAPQGLQKPRHQTKADHRRQNYTAAHQQHLNNHLATDQGFIIS